MRRTILFLILAVCIAALPSLSRAADLPQSDPHWFESPRNFSAGFNVGMIFPTASEIQDVYGTKGDAVYTLQGSWRIVHELELHAEGSYAWFGGHGVSPEGDKTGEKYKMHVVPAELGLMYRFNFVIDQPVVPYIGAHYTYTYWIEEKLESPTKDRGLLSGWSGQAGLMFLLDKIDMASSGRLESEWGINNTYFFYQYKYLASNDFGADPDKTLDLSSHVHTLGVLFQF